MLVVTGWWLRAQVEENVNFGDHIVYLDIGGYNFMDGSFVEISLHTSEVPISATIYLFGSGLFALIGIARRKT